MATSTQRQAWRINGCHMFCNDGQAFSMLQMLLFCLHACNFMRATFTEGASVHTGDSHVAQFVSHSTLPLLAAVQISIGTCYVPGRETWSRTVLYSICFV